MRKIKSLAVCVVMGLLTLIVIGQTKQQVNPDPRGDLLERRVQGADVEYYTTHEAFTASLNRAGVPGGMARVVNCEKDMPKQE
jgi:hypothetical protein